MELVFVRTVIQVRRAQLISMNVDRPQFWGLRARMMVSVLILWPVISAIVSQASKAIGAKT